MIQALQSCVHGLAPPLEVWESAKMDGAFMASPQEMYGENFDWP